MVPGFYRALTDPRSVAIVGASNTPGKTTSRPLGYLRAHAWDGEIYPVNPSRETVLGERAWQSLSALPTVPDHVLVLTAADAAVEAVRECAALGVPIATLIADGFLPSDSEGRRRRAELKEILAGSSLRLLGPSSLGIANLHRRMPLTGNAAFADDTLPSGDIFVASQSGSALGALLSRGAEMGLGFASMVSTGNELDLSLGEICRCAVDDPQVAGFALFLENLTHAEDLAEFARLAAERGKPVAAYKLGRSDAGAQLAVSHTGALAGDDVVADAFLTSLGIARVTTFEALLEVQHLARRVPVSHMPSRPRVGVVSTTGGGGAMVVDALADRGATLAVPSTETARRLADLGVHVGAGALIDLTLAGTRYATIKAVLEVLTDAPEFDAVVAVPGSSARFTPEVSVAPIIECADRGTPLVAFVVPAAPDALAMLRAKGVSAFRTPESCADAVVAVFKRRAPVRGEVAVVPPTGVAPVPLDENDSYTLLEEVGVECAARTVVRLEDLPAELPVPGPAVVKLIDSSVQHKSELGGVVLDVMDGPALAEAAARIRDAVAERRPGLTVDRVLVQQMVSGVAEALIGFRRDPDVGPVVMVAAGGVLTELYRDRSVRPAPVDPAEARAMVREVVAFRAIDGYRNLPRGDLDALARAVSAVSRLGLREPVVAEAELNPVLVRADGDGVVAVDAVVSVYPEAQ
ncbi:acetate--CoA ligase family protein [Nocardia sp. CA2R105]|uniref:acetate--CoA ligase family protein n=1 Tax=Nocardia coffeae TaxID=2873381 RepID=UPI001CA6DCA6|nr:acetate--CoA ligase family protein [Nocardia coffeae]MBY8863612.1 acetate--CoA ligase family protein [Nocardia coffeae]